MPSKVQCYKIISQINNQNMFQTCVFNQYVARKETPLNFNLFFECNDYEHQNLKKKLKYH